MKLELKKLISSRLFGELIRSEEPGFKNREDYLILYESQRNNYDDFLKQQLAIWMFVPCKLVDGVWVVLEEPKDWKNWQDVYIANNTEGKTKDRYTSQLSARWDCQEYQEAKDWVLFEGFKFKEAEHSTHRSFIKFPNKSRMLLYPDLWRLLTIEDLVKYNLELTPAAEKQIGI